MNVAKAYFIILMVLTSTLSAPAIAGEAAPAIEVFTDSTFQVVSASDNTTVYVMDRINQLLQVLSEDLPSDPENAKQLVLARFQRMDAQLSSELENAAKGLVQAMQYGINRYPAIVINGNAVVYGVTDVSAATQLYQRWQTRGARQ
ncbi:TIGR03757 family integrating conjugative element protein [Nitrosococcus oceani]|nr:TIGR03757 family integrating conjugative element protein [Nitrosococcus oceani]GEM19807.1 integrating conjugative element protein [Nitrosococcus oceani]